MPLDVEGVVDRRVGGEDSLDRGLRLEPLLLSLSPSDRQMRILRPIVVPQAIWSMKVAQCHPVERCPAGHQAVRRNRLGFDGVAVHQVSQELERSLCVPPALDQEVQI
jgi:hypothetical protein